MNMSKRVFKVKRLTVRERFDSKIEIIPFHTCHEWTGSIKKSGYGRFGKDRKTVLAHRVSYELNKGLISSGLVIDHLCRNRSCVNPQHLEAVTQDTNVKRSVEATKLKCIRGHLLLDDNLVKRIKNRNCRTCKNMRQRLNRQKRGLNDQRNTQQLIEKSNSESSNEFDGE